MIKNLIDKLENAKGIINPRYDATLKDFDVLYNAYSNDIFRLIEKSFEFGYMQGYKSAQSEHNKKIKATK